MAANSLKLDVKEDNPMCHHRFCFQLVISIGIGLVMAGCAAVGPDYRPVTPDAPERWHAEMDGGLIAAPPEPDALAGWWSTFEDRALSRLMEQAASGNLSIQTARARVREARALRGISRAGLFPSVDAGASAARLRSSESGGTGRESEFYSAGFDAGWELDIFGGVRRSIEAAQADLEASREELNGVLITLMAEVALNYVDMRTFQARLTTTAANIKTLENSYLLNQSRYQAGLIDELALQESVRILETARSQMPVLETGLSAAKNRLAVLLGKQPGQLAQELEEKAPIPALPARVAVGIPAEMLRRRPDVKRTERDLAAQTARIGVATAELYPKFRLAGTIGLEAVDGGAFLEQGSRVWGFGPSAYWNIFDAGAIRQKINAQTARQEQAMIRYQATVLAAQEEVENALVAYAKEQIRGDSLVKAAAAAKRAELLAAHRYQMGLVGFNNVLDAQRALLLLQNDLDQSRGTATANLVRLYKALGGGWEYAALATDPVEATP
jgi:NodT family efflux transporter outer membrane factor (OMF) lipoprotein